MQFRGVALAHVHRRGKGYGSGTSGVLIKDLRARGINLVQLNPFGYQPSPAQRTISFSDPTLTRADLTREIRAIHRAGLSVMLAPHIWIGHDASPAVWRSKLRYTEPHEVAEWFASYRKFILHYARIAIRERVAIFAVGVELEQLTVHVEQFRALIREIRSVGYQGLLTYECEAWNAKNIQFWADLDFVGLNFYYSHSVEAREKNGSDFGSLTKFLAAKLKAHYAHAHSVGRPVVLTEFGYPGHDLAVSKTSAWPSSMSTRDDEAQRTGFAAMRDALKIAGTPHGIVFWKYVTTLDSYERDNYATDFIVQGKPAEQVLTEIVRLR